jgi:hypothetical protein
MKKTFTLFILLIIYHTSLAQAACESTNLLSGTWTATVEEHPMKFEITADDKDSPIFSFTNFLNERFIVLKSKISVNEKSEFVIKILEAKFSSPNYEKCKYSTGVLTLSEISTKNMTLNLNSVGPNCFLSYDVIMNMPDIENIKLTKEQSNN